MDARNRDPLAVARKLIDAFLQRTGVLPECSSGNERYLWTDALAVTVCLALGEAFDEIRYRHSATRLIEVVHESLGRFREDDERVGWISGLSEEEGRRHPTSRGLRIGKEVPERKPHEQIDERLEWDRDGQYLHYLTRWVDALLKARLATNDRRYGMWAGELAGAFEHFLERGPRPLRLFWKMSIDLSRPLVESMGMHDPLDALMALYSVEAIVPEAAGELRRLKVDLERLCDRRNWVTTDPLGIGGLLLHFSRAAELASRGCRMSDAVRPETLLRVSVRSLDRYVMTFHPRLPAAQRLAFRECGLSLGLRVAADLGDDLVQRQEIADDIETFWCDSSNRFSPSWKDYENINAVTLAASLTAAAVPSAFR